MHEELKTANMTRRPKARPDSSGSYESNGAAAKAGLNKSINDAGWGIFLINAAVNILRAGLALQEASEAT